MKEKIAIIGTRGIPNNYGGFEQFAEYLSVGLVDKGILKQEGLGRSTCYVLAV